MIKLLQEINSHVISITSWYEISPTLFLAVLLVCIRQCNGQSQLPDAYQGKYHTDTPEYEKIGPYARMPFKLYDNRTKACQRKLKLPVLLNEEQVNKLWSCTFKRWLRVVKLCKEDYFKNFPELKTAKRDTGDMQSNVIASLESIRSNESSGNSTITIKDKDIEYADWEDQFAAFDRAGDTNGEFTVNFTTPFERVPRAVLDCALNRSDYHAGSPNTIQIKISTLVLCLAILKLLLNNIS